MLGFVGLLVNPRTRELTFGEEGSTRFLAVVGYVLFVASVNLAMGIGLTGLKTWARWTEVVLSSLSICYTLLVAGLSARTSEILGQLAFFAIVPAFILILLLSPKGAMVFSPEYRTIIYWTPHIKYQTSVLLKGCLIFLVAVVVIGFAAAILAPLMISRR